MARISYADDTDLNEDQQAFLKDLPPINIFRMLAHAPDVAKGFTALGNKILFKSKIDPVLREIAILRAGHLAKAAYEIFQHERIGRDLGMSDELLAAIGEGPDAAAFDDEQRLVMRYADALALNVKPDDDLFNEALNHFGAEELIELTLATGYYMMVSRFLETFEVDIEGDPVDAAHFRRRINGRIEGED